MIARLLYLIPLFVAASAQAQTLAVPDAGWRVWPDVHAAWRDDRIYLPDEVRLGELPVHPPTGGWAALHARQGVATSLPSTVEAHYWGKLGLRPYRNGEYYYEGDDPEVRNGAYQGVSWWWRSVDVPQGFAGKRCLLRLRGARQRAEIYVNRRLVGYSIMAESADAFDVTAALRPGRTNEIAIRITNPGGRLDWPDWETLSWGGVDLQKGHGFGGLDRGLTLEAHTPVALTDAWVLNTPDVRTVRASATLRNDEPRSAVATVRATVVDPKTSRPLGTATSAPIRLRPGESRTVPLVLRCPSAALWSPANPHLYRLELQSGVERRDVNFGFRWFAPDGIGTNAVLRLNGERIRVFSAISWGFWGIDGLFPTPDLATKEVAQAKRLGLNALNFHRNVGRAEVLDAQDRMGLLRYMEPGGGDTAIGPPAQPGDDGGPRTRGERYTEEKLVRMVHDFRSHPSLVLYVIQNERGDTDSNNPRIDHLMRRMHAEDPSRTLVLKSGLSPRGEVWMRPYDATIYRADGHGENAGWWDNHTVGYPDATWTDADYQGPRDHVYATDNAKEIVDWGEMGGSGTPDDHAAMLREIARRGGSSYDAADHREILAAYDAFLTRWGFRKAFPTASDLFRSVGNRQYEYWGNVLGAARLSDANDYLTLSGWETTAVENHSGVVDNLRNFHGDPDRIASMLRPTMPAVWPRKTSVNVGEAVRYDLFFLNETGRPNATALRATLTAPDGRTTSLGTYSIPAAHRDTFVYPVRTDQKTPPLTRPGTYRLSVEARGVWQSREILCVGTPALRPLRIGVLGSIGRLAADLASLKGVTMEPFRPEAAYDVLVAGGGGSGTLYSAPDDLAISGTEDPALFRRQAYGKSDDLELVVSGLSDAPAQVTLLFAETYHRNAGARRFDVKANGETVIEDLDVFAQTGGIGRALTKTFTVRPADGTITIAPGDVEADNATFAGVKVVSGGKTVAYAFIERPYTDRSGVVWRPYRAGAPLGAGALAQVRAGTPLLIDTADDGVADSLARQLANAGAFRYDGMVGRARAPWMGSWSFVRAHPIYAGLPVDEVMHADYGIGTSRSNGLVVAGAGVEVVTGYGRDHGRRLGASDFVAHLGRGRLLFHLLPPPNEPLRRRWLTNALNFLAP